MNDDVQHLEMVFWKSVNEGVNVADALQVLLLFGSGKEAVEVPIRHQRLLQLPQILFQRARHRFALEHVHVLVVGEECKAFRFSLFAVEAHKQELVDLRPHAAHAVKSFFLEAALLQALDALLNEREAHVVDAVLFLLRGAALARSQVHRLLSVHRVQPRLPIDLGKGLERVNDARLLVERHVEAEALLKVGDASRAAREAQLFGR